MCDEFGVCKYDIVKDFHGKPYLSDNEFNISISHSFDYCAVMFHPFRNVGVDIQKIEDKLLPLAPKFLTDREIEMLKDNLLELCIAWSAKEAAYKHTGVKGLSMKNNFHIIEPPADNSLIIKYVMENDEAFFLSTTYTLFGDYVMAYIAE
jgi:phosphopantetheinyl transferase